MNQEASIDKQHYFNPKYLKRERMYSFIEQIELVKKFAGMEDTILEVGKGNGFVSRFLKEYLSYRVRSVDVNEDLEPDILDDITRPKQVNEKSFDVITCYEVLEHMPFGKSIEAMQNMIKIARKFVLISIPDMRYFINCRLSIFGTLPLNIVKLISTRRFRRKSKTFGKDHFWEIGIKVDGINYSADFIKQNLFKGMNVRSDYRCPSVPWHHYYAVKVD